MAESSLTYNDIPLNERCKVAIEEDIHLREGLHHCGKEQVSNPSSLEPDSDRWNEIEEVLRAKEKALSEESDEPNRLSPLPPPPMPTPRGAEKNEQGYWI